MKWRVAESLVILRGQINKAYPTRSKVSDGTVADAAHQKAGTSDHIPNSDGVVTAFDCTHDPAHGCDASKIAEALIASRDSRIKYIIHNKRICASYPSNGKQAWTWRPYSGANAHQKHIHVSVLGDKALYDSADEWSLPEVTEVNSVAVPTETTTEKVITTTTTATEDPAKTVEKKSIIETVTGNEQVKTIASTGMSSIGNKLATGGISGGAMAAVGAFLEKAWPVLIFAGVLIVLGVLVWMMIYHHNHREKQIQAAIASDPTKTDIVFAKK